MPMHTGPGEGAPTVRRRVGDARLGDPKVWGTGLAVFVATAVSMLGAPGARVLASTRDETILRDSTRLAAKAADSALKVATGYQLELAKLEQSVGALSLDVASARADVQGLRADWQRLVAVQCLAYTPRERALAQCR